METSTPLKRTHEWVLWMVAASCVLHPLEEYFTGWQKWAVDALGIVMPTQRFVIMNIVLAAAAFIIAGFGWRRPTLSLVIPTATLVNAIVFHILPTIVERRVSPGIYSAAFLYLPFSSWALIGARRDGVSRGALVLAFVIGSAMMMSVVVTARWLSI